MKQGFYFSAVALAALVATTFPTASHADSLVSVRTDGSVARVEALPSNGATTFSAPTSKYTSVATAAQTKSSAQLAPEMDWEEVEASLLLGKIPPGQANFDSEADTQSQELDEQSLRMVRSDLEKYPSGQVRVEGGNTFWVDPNGEPIMLSDNNRIAASSRPGSQFVGRRHRRYFSPFYLTRFFSRFSPGYVFYMGRPGYLYRVPLGHYIGGYPVYGYPGYGYPGYGYPGYYPGYDYPAYRYPAYDYPGYYSYSTTFSGPGSLTRTYREKTNGGIGVSVGRRGVGVSLRSGSTTTSRSTITADVAPGSRITTSTITPYPYYGTVVPRMGGATGTPQGLGGTSGSLLPRSSGLGGVNNPYPSSAFETSGSSPNLTPPASPVMIRPRIR